MTQKSNSFEGGTNGTAITPANSGGASGDAFNTLSSGGSNTAPVFDNTHTAHSSSMACRFAPASTNSCWFRWTFASNVASLAYRGYYYASAGAALAAQIVELCTAAGSVVATVLVQGGTGKIQVKDNTGTVTYGTMSTACPLGAYFRVEVLVTCSTTNGSITVNRYDTADSTTPDDTLTLTGLAMSNATAGGWQVGPHGFPSISYWCDDIAANDTGTAIGPTVTAITSTDSATGSEAVQLALGTTDSGSETDSVGLRLGVTDSGAGSSVESLAATVASVDSGVGSELVIISVSSTDSGACAETTGVSPVATDTATETETVALSTAVNAADAGTSIATVSISLGASSDSAAESEVNAVVATVSSVDSGVGTESVAMNASSSDSGAGTSTVSISPQVTDSAVEAELALLAVTLSSTDWATEVEALNPAWYLGAHSVNVANNSGMVFA